MATSDSKAFPAPKPRAIKCGTPHVLELLGSRGKIASARRDNLTTSVLSSHGHFRVHYDSSGFHAPAPDDTDGNGIPDFVDSTMVYLEYAWDLQVNQMGFRAPKGDNGTGGGDEIDIYIKNFENDAYIFYALTYPDQVSGGTSSAYILIDNNYDEEEYQTHGYDALKVTTAHEFFHAVHFAYSTDINRLLWWMEQTATWMENRAWEDVNDYFLYIGDFFRYAKTLPLTTTHHHDASYFMYGAAVWPMYLAEKHGDHVVREGWEAMVQTSYPDLTTLDPVIPGGLNSALNEFGVWLYFTGSRAAPGYFFHDAPQFGYTMDMDLSLEAYPAQDSLATTYSTSNYAELLFAGDWTGADRLRIRCTPTGGRVHENSFIFSNGPGDFRIERIDSDDTALPLGKHWTRGVLVTTSVSPNSGAGRFHITAEHEKLVAADDNTPSLFAVLGSIPNPFNPSTAIRFTLPDRCLVSVRAFNIQGQMVADLFKGELSAGEKQVLWKPRDLAGGVYLIHVSTPYGSQTAKVLLLK